jgi:hypothetical protein
MNLAEHFRGELLGKPIPNFPYPDKPCRYCNKKCELIDAIHISAHPEDYKVLFICMNNKCDAYDEPARRAYAKVYYSSDEAYKKLELHRIWFDRKKLD